MALAVSEIFTSIQGESTWAGLPCLFIRLAGCNLRCRWCDTRHSHVGGEAREVADLLALARSQPCPLVEVTGGEPLLQDETPALVAGLVRDGFRVLVETNGSRDISVLDPGCAAIVDVKGPSSGEAGSFDPDNLGRLRPADELKFVLAHREDYLFARDMVRELVSGTGCARGAGSAPGVRPTSFPNPIHFSPAFGLLDPRTLAAWILEDMLPVRLGMQWHKYIWGPDVQGV